MRKYGYYIMFWIKTIIRAANLLIVMNNEVVLFFQQFENPSPL